MAVFSEISEISQAKCALFASNKWSRGRAEGLLTRRGRREAFLPRPPMADFDPASRPAAVSLPPDAAADLFGVLSIASAPTAPLGVLACGRAFLPLRADKRNRPVSFTSGSGAIVIECAYDTYGRSAAKKGTTNGPVTLHQCHIC